jgi:hypothetical protein
MPSLYDGDRLNPLGRSLYDELVGITRSSFQSRGDVPLSELRSIGHNAISKILSEIDLQRISQERVLRDQGDGLQEILRDWDREDIQ